MKKRTFLRTLSFILTLMLVIAVSAIGAFAAEEGTGAGNAAKVGDVEYATVQEAIAAANENDTVYLLRDIDAAEIITVDKAITLNGNGKTITSTAARAINVDCNGTVTIENLTVVASGERAINVIQKPATLVINNVNATAANYAINVAGSAAGATITVNDSNLTGMSTVNIGAENVNVEINDTVINCIEENASENYGAITINSYGENSHVVVNGGEIVLTDDSDAAAVFSATASVTFNGTENSDKVEYIVACVGMAGYNTLEDAISVAAKSGSPVVLMRDITLTEKVVISSEVMINGNGHKITSTAKKAFEIVNSTENPIYVTFNDVDIENTAAGGRCIDTRNDYIAVVIANSTITAKNSVGNNKAQPITIGGYENEGTMLMLDNTTVEADGSGYAIICFVMSGIEITNGSYVSGYAAVYMQAGSANSYVSVNNSTVESVSKYAYNQGQFGTIVFTDDGCMIELVGATVKATANGTSNQSALLLNGALTYVSVDADTSIVTNGTAARAFAEFAQGQVIEVDNVEISGVLAEELAGEGFFIEDGGMISELVSIRDVRVMLGQDISMIYTVRVHESVKATCGIAMIFERNGYETLVTDCIDMGYGYYAFVFSKIAPQTMSDIINASLVLTDGEGNVVDTVAELNGYSVKANLAYLLSMNANVLGMTPEAYEAMAQLIADTLEYGKAAQDYTGHNKDNPANDSVAGKPAASEWETLGETDKTVTDSVSEELYFTAAGVRFDYVNRMYFKFYAKDIAGVTVTIDGVTYTEADFVSLGAGEYAVYGTELYATDFDYVATVVLGVAGEDVQTLTYSVKSYVYAKQNSDNAVMAALARALYNYGKSAEKYMESMI